MSIYRNNYRTSAKGIELIKSFESLRLQPYKDLAGKWTIGYGHLMTPYEQRNPRSILVAEALQLLAFDVRTYELFVNSCVRVPISQYQFDALVSLCYNIGCGAFESSTLLRALNAGDILTAANEFWRWNKYTNPKTGLKEVARGLTRRRAAESALFVSEIKLPVSAPVDTPQSFAKPLVEPKPSYFLRFTKWLAGGSQ